MYEIRQPPSSLPSFEELEQPVQAELRVYSHDRVLSLPMSSQLLAMDMSALKQHIQKQLGYSSRIHAYLSPVCSFNKLSMLATTNPSLSLRSILSHISPCILCFTYNNTQSSQQPQYNHTPVYSRPLTAQTVQIVVQICQNNYFVHESYRIKRDAQIGFIIGLCARYGRNIFAQYYNTRIKLSQFGNEAMVASTLGRFVDHMDRVIVTADSVNAHAYRTNNQAQTNQSINNLNDCFQNIHPDFPIDTKFYFRLKIETSTQANPHYYAICRKCSISTLTYMLKNITKQQIKLYHTLTKKQTNTNQQSSLQSQQIAITNQFISDQSINTISCRLNPKQNLLYKLHTPIQNCQLIGQTNSAYYFIQNSHILHVVALSQSQSSHDAISLIQHMLPCVETAELDQDLFFMHESKSMLVSYAITITMVKVKYYGLDGELLYLRVWPWSPQEYQIQFKVVDLFCVRLKSTGSKSMKRIFFIDDPQNYMDVGPCQKFYPARLANNIYSDGSGLFAITNHWMEGIQIFSLKTKHKLCEFRPIPNLYPKIHAIQFTEHDPNTSFANRRVIVNYRNEQISIYNIETGEEIVKILCEKYMTQVMCIGRDIVSWQGNQVRVFRFQEKKYKGKQQRQQLRVRKMLESSCTNQLKMMQWSEPIYVGQSDVIILPSGQALCRQQSLKYQNFTSFYLYQL